MPIEPTSGAKGVGLVPADASRCYGGKHRRSIAARQSLVGRSGLDRGTADSLDSPVVRVNVVTRLMIRGLFAFLLAAALGACQSAETPRAFITAASNPLSPGRTTITWSTGDARPGRVTVSVDGAPEALFASGSRGRQEAAWISAGSRYEFRLYDVDSGALLWVVTVKRGTTNAWPWLLAVALGLAGLLMIAGLSRRALRRAWSALASTTSRPLPSAGHFWFSLVALVVGVKLAVLALDAVPRIFLGDSGVYLLTALNGSIPYDRSFTYGWAIWLVTGPGHEIGRLLAAQVMASVASALLMGAALRAGFGVPYGLVAAGTVLVTVEPLQLAYERFIMTETLAGLCLAILAVVALCYLRRPRAILLVVCTVCGVALLSLRMNAVFVAWLVPLALPLIARRRLSSSPRSLRPWLHVGAALLALVTTHGAYRLLYGYLQNGSAAYHYAGGRFSLAFASPMVRIDDFPDVALGARILADVKVPLRLPREARNPLYVRDSHCWGPDGIMAAIRRHSDSALSADALARTVALNAVWRDPAEAVRLGLLTLRSYFDPTLTGVYDHAAFAALVILELGPATLPSEDQLRAFRISPASTGPSLMRTWHVAGVCYYPFILLCPLVALVAVALAPHACRPAATFVFIVSATLIATGPFLAASTVIRYLHPLAWMNVLVLVLVVHWAFAPSRRRPTGSPPGEQPGQGAPTEGRFLPDLR